MSDSAHHEVKVTNKRVLDEESLAAEPSQEDATPEDTSSEVDTARAEAAEVLEKEGLERIDVLEKRFDPELHEAVMHSEGDGEELVVVDEMRPGYKLGGRVLRPAMVKVARGKATG
ncbi:MAG: nucleotide exchange factor GrpE [Actinobacteria bacterium]|nr:nucleotide exchange factor GrpE [Actinomycetota bacterium]